MAADKSTSTPAPESPEEALQELLALPVADRVIAVAQDVIHHASKYRDVPAHDLAEALGVPQPEQPGGDGWLFIRYAEIVTVEEYARNNFPASELILLIENAVDPERFQHLLALSEPLDDAGRPSFSFLLRSEREALEYAIAEDQLQNDSCLNRIARYAVKTSSGSELEFEGDIEDDGSCVDLRSPYDKQEKKFRDLTRCLTYEWY